MNNKAIKTLLDKVKEFEDFFNEYEKQFYPKVINYYNVDKLCTLVLEFW